MLDELFKAASPVCECGAFIERTEITWAGRNADGAWILGVAAMVCLRGHRTLVEPA